MYKTACLADRKPQHNKDKGKVTHNKGCYVGGFEFFTLFFFFFE